jgi:hypothetical protein
MNTCLGHADGGTYPIRDPPKAVTLQNWNLKFLVQTNTSPNTIGHEVDNHRKKHIHFNLNHWVMHPVARVSTSICRNLRTQQMSVLGLLCTSYTTCFGPYWWPSSGGL